MTTQLICKLLRSREAAAAVDVRAWPPILDTGWFSNSPKMSEKSLFKSFIKNDSFDYYVFLGDSIGEIKEIIDKNGKNIICNG